MVVTWTTICAAVLLVARNRDTRDRLEMKLHSITPEALHILLLSNQDVLVFDVRRLLDLLGDSVIIPGAKWIAPLEAGENPSLIPRENDLVVHCTCPNDKTSCSILRRALAMGFLRIRKLDL